MRTRRQVLYGFAAATASALALRTRDLFAASPFAKTAVDFDVPRGACDSHVHIFDPARFPFAAKRVYTPPVALVSAIARTVDATS